MRDADPRYQLAPMPDKQLTGYERGDCGSGSDQGWESRKPETTAPASFINL